MSRILIIEDNETMRTGIALVVERMGHKPVPVASGPEGLVRMREEAFDLRHHRLSYGRNGRPCGFGCGETGPS